MNKFNKDCVKRYIQERIAIALEWYVQGDAVNCQETRDCMNKDISSILRDAEKRYNLKPMSLTPQVSISEDGVVLTRFIDPRLS